MAAPVKRTLEELLSEVTTLSEEIVSSVPGDKKLEQELKG